MKDGMTWQHDLVIAPRNLGKRFLRPAPLIAPLWRVSVSPAGRRDPFFAECFGDVPVAPPARSHPEAVLNDRRLRRHLPLAIRGRLRLVSVGQGVAVTSHRSSATGESPKSEFES